MTCGGLEELETRFTDKVKVSASGCWLWQASGVRGYGLYRISGPRSTNKKMLAHKRRKGVTNVVS